MLPTLVDDLQGFKIIDVFLGFFHSYAIASDGAVFYMGGKKSIIANIRQQTLKDNDTKEIAVGPYHFLALSNDGTLYSWSADLKSNHLDGKLGYLLNEKVLNPKVV